MSDIEEEKLQRRLHQLQEEHRDLDTAISAMSDQGVFDQLQLQRMKKRKLQLKDEIARLEDQIYPDIIA
jgi:hypothetical protein